MEIPKKLLFPVLLLLAGLFVYKYYDYPVAVQVTRGIDQTEDQQERTDETLVARRDVRYFVDSSIRYYNPARIEICPLHRRGDLGRPTQYSTNSRDRCQSDYVRAGYQNLVEAAAAAEVE